MKLAFPALGGFLLVPFLCLVWQQNSFQQKSQQAPKESAASSERPQSRKNPVKPTPENLAEAKKFFGYECAMCHGAAGDGKGDLAASMGLKMNDWHDTSTLAAMSDGEIFDLIVLPASAIPVSLSEASSRGAAIWLYAAARPRFGAGPKTAGLTGFTYWIMGTALPTLGQIPVGLFSKRLSVCGQRCRRLVLQGMILHLQRYLRQDAPT